MPTEQKMRYHVSLRFEGIQLPPFQDILILGKKCPQGPQGLLQCFTLLGGDEFEVIPVEDPKVEVMLVNKKILLRLPRETLIAILRERVFPFITKGELVRVDVRVVLSWEEIEGTIDPLPS